MTVRIRQRQKKYLVRKHVAYGRTYNYKDGEGYSHYTKATMQEMEYSYGIFQGCMVKQENGKWIDYNRLRYME